MPLFQDAPGGNDTNIQFNDEGILGGNDGFVFNKTKQQVDVSAVDVQQSSMTALNATATVSDADGELEAAGIIATGLVGGTELTGATVIGVSGNASSIANADAVDAVMVGGQFAANVTAGNAASALRGVEIMQPDIAGTADAVVGLRIRNQSGGGTSNRAIQTGTGTVDFGDLVQLVASSTARASINIPAGTAPTSPVDGDVWFDGTNLKIRVGGATKTFTIT